MSNTTEALNLFRRAEKPVIPNSEYEREQQSIRSNFERLKAERLAREALANHPA